MCGRREERREGERWIGKREERAESREQRAESREQRAESREQRAESREIYTLASKRNCSILSSKKSGAKFFDWMSNLRVCTPACRLAKVQTM
jgi:hypothetical protein